MASRHDTLHGNFGTLISQATRSWRRAVDRRLQPFGLTEATWLPLVHLARAPAPLRQKELAAALSLDGSSVVRLLDALEAAGLAERREEGGDRRAKAIALTHLGRSTVAQVEIVAKQVREEALAGLSDAEIASASRVLDHVCAVLSLPVEEASS